MTCRVSLNRDVTKPEEAKPICPVCKGAGKLYWLLNVRCYQCGGDKSAPTIDPVQIR